MDSLIDQNISIDPAICHGKPCFRINGKPSRIMIHLVLELLEAGVTVEEITSSDYYPQLTREHIRAVLHFAAEQLKNRDFIAFSK